MLFAATSHIACFMDRDSSNVGPHSEPFVMVDHNPHLDTDAPNCQAQPAAQASAQGTGPPVSQGTDSVHRTWYTG